MNFANGLAARDIFV